MSHRLFVAIRPPAAVRDLLIDHMEGLEGANWQDEDQLHLTLRYCGECEASQVDDLAAALGTVCGSPFDCRVRDAGYFEKRGRAHTLWAGVEHAPELLRLQKNVERACQRAGLAPETRKFAPHVTIARLNASTAPLGPWPAAHGDLSAPPFLATEFILYESHLGDSGSLYEPITRYTLA